ncbi:MAG: NTP transferase domain-containing protein [Candidatus Thorarchaeota archaeon]|jgi:NDP-sugar pyrophosphorylase family protein
MLFESLTGGISIHAMILAAGRGSRMGALGDSIPKGLIPLTGRTIVTRLVEVMAASGVDSFHIGVGWKSKLFTEHLKTLADLYSIEVVEVSSIERGPLHTLVTALESWDDGPFLISPVDYVVPASIVKQLIREHKSGGASRGVTICVDSKSGQGSPTYVRNDGRVSGIGSSLSEYDTIHQSAMLAAANPGTVGHFRSAHASGDKTVAAAMNQMISKKVNVYATIVTEQWVDIDSVTDLLRAKDMILNEQVETIEGSIFVPAGSTIEVGVEIKLQSGTLLESGVSIKGPTFIGSSCRIEQNCRVGPYVSMEHHTTLSREADIEKCVLFSSACVAEGAHIKNAIVYGNSIIEERV